MKKFFYVTSLPRTGQTVLGSLLHQNKDICFTPQSQVLECMYGFLNFKTYNFTYGNFRNEFALDSAIHAFRDKFYETFTDANYILERGYWGTQVSREILASFEEKPKFIIMYRPIVESLAALIKTELPYLDIPVLKRCQFLMKPNGIFYRRIKSIEGALKEDHIVIHYKDFMNKPEETVERIYKYMGLKFKGVRTTNLDDYEIKGIKYRDVVLDDFPFQNRHTLKKDKIEEEKINPKDYLPSEIYKQFKDSDVL